MKSPVVCSKEMLEIALAYDLKIKKLKEEENKFLNDEVVKMYFNVLKEIKKTEQDKQSALHKYNSNMQKNCTHPMYVCYNYDTPVRIDYYECMCLHCGKITNMTYKEVAKELGDEEIISPVKEVLDNSSFPILLPSHRIINSLDDIGGFVGGEEKKRYLLELENIICK